MNGNIKQLVDVTICYPGGIPSFWQFISGQVAEVRVAVEVSPISAALIGDYHNDPGFQRHFQKWINDLWQQKERRLQQLSQ